MPPPFKVDVYSDGAVDIVSYGKLQYEQNERGKSILIDSDDIKNLAITVNKIDEDVTLILDGFKSKLPDGSPTDMKSIVDLIVNGDAAPSDVLYGKTFTSGNGVAQTGTMPIGSDIEVDKATTLSKYSSSDKKLTLGIDKGYYEDKSAVLDMTDLYKSIYDEGYASGVVDGKKQAIGSASVNYTYHTHTGNSTDGGGCYSSANYHSHSGGSSGGGCYTVARTGYKYCDTRDCQKVTCDGTMNDIRDAGSNGDGSYWFEIYCSKCGAYGGRRGSSAAWTCGYVLSSSCPGNHPYTYYDLGCGKSTSTVESYSLGCGKTTSTIESATINFN